MKKAFSRVMVSVLACAVVALSGFGQQAFAAVPSPTTNKVEVSGATATVNGQATDISTYLECSIAADIPSTTLTPAEKERFETAFSAVKTEDAAAGFTTVGMFDLHLVNDADGKIAKAIEENGLTVTLKVNGGLEAGKAYQFYHCNSTADPKNLSTWEHGSCKVNVATGTCEITIHSLSPIAIVAEKSATSNPASGAPATGSNAGEHNLLILWAIVGGVAFCGAVAVGVYALQAKKKKKN